MQGAVVLSLMPREEGAALRRVHHRHNRHIHALVADGLFTDNGMFYVAPRVSTTPLEQRFRVRVIRMLVEEELLAPELARKLLGWKHSGFRVRNGSPTTKPAISVTFLLSR